MFSEVYVLCRRGSGRGQPSSSHISPTIRSNNQSNSIFIAYCGDIIPLCCELRRLLVVAAMFSEVTVLAVVAVVEDNRRPPT